MGRMTRLAAATTAAVLVVGLGACGDDDETETGAPSEEAATDDAAAGENAAFCDGIVEFNGAVLASEIDETSSEEDIKAAGEQLGPLFERVAESAPADLAEQADQLNGYIQPLREGDAEAFSSDETFEEYTELVAGAVEACGFETVDVTGVDYAFEGVPETIEAGTVAFSFANGSEAEEHEMLIVRKADGVDLSWEEILDAPEEESEELVEFKGAAFAPPGGSSATMAELSAGEYAMVCFVPVGGDESGPPHVAEGMLQEFTVE